jgi:FkbM family methyltransferase
MDGYIIKEFTDLIDKSKVKTILELGARFGDESLALSSFYPDCQIHAFECNPLVLPETRKNLENNPKIKLHEVAVSNVTNENVTFYPAKENPEASSLFVAKLGKWWGDHEPVIVKTQRLDDYFKSNGIENIDMICADIQGGELNAFEGMGDFLSKVTYIITEIPSGPPTYDGAPSREEILNYLDNKGFRELSRTPDAPYEQDMLFVNNNI